MALLGEATDGFTLRWAELVRLEIDHAQRAEGIAISVDQWHAAVKAEVGFADHDRQILETRVLSQVRHIEKVVRADRRVAYRDLARTFDKVRPKPVLRLEPLPALLEQTEDGGRAIADLSRKFSQRVVSEFRRRIKDLIEGEGGQAIRLVYGHRLEHGPLRGTLSELNLSRFGQSVHRGGRWNGHRHAADVDNRCPLWVISGLPHICAEKRSCH
jgi:hypothetical protein